jgi:hypothetical protein
LFEPIGIDSQDFSSQLGDDNLGKCAMCGAIINLKSESYQKIAKSAGSSLRCRHERTVRSADK